jgi:LacI family transcriptional regulator
MSKATIVDVASLAGVSTKTVSRVVNDEPNVRRSTKEKVDRAIAMLAYEPNQAARNLVAFRTRQRLQP